MFSVVVAEDSVLSGTVSACLLSLVCSSGERTMTCRGKPGGERLHAHMASLRFLRQSVNTDSPNSTFLLLFLFLLRSRGRVIGCGVFLGREFAVVVSVAYLRVVGSGAR